MIETLTGLSLKGCPILNLYPCSRTDRPWFDLAWRSR